MDVFDCGVIWPASCADYKIKTIVNEKIAKDFTSVLLVDEDEVEWIGLRGIWKKKISV